MRSKLLLKLADFLDNLPRKRFNICVFGDKDFSPKECGTQACALGWAPTAFPRSNLWLSDDDWYYNKQVNYKDTKGKIYRDERAGAKFFDIPKEHAFKLFVESADNKKLTRKQMAKKLRAYVKDHKDLGLTFDTKSDEQDEYQYSGN